MSNEHLCPICGYANRCGFAAGLPGCWCMEVVARRGAGVDPSACLCKPCLTRMVTPLFVHFKTCDLAHFERAWWSVANQRMRMNRPLVFDNNSDTPWQALHAVAGRTAVVASLKHGDPAKTHPYSVNAIVDIEQRTRKGGLSSSVDSDWVLFTRSDYLLAPDCARTLLVEASKLEAEGLKPFVSGWCYQSAYTREQVDLPMVNPDEAAPWRTDWNTLVDGRIPGYCFSETDQDAGVWLTRLRYLQEAGPMNEQLSAWGYAQSTYQRELKAKAGVTCVTVPRYLFFHQHHGVWARDHAVARQQYDQFGGGR